MGPSRYFDLDEIHEIKHYATQHFSTIFHHLTGASPKLHGNGTFRCACPLHAGSDGLSFEWRGDAGTWCCYSSCGTVGTAIDFIMAQQGLEFLPAIHLAAEILGYSGNANTALPPEPARTNTDPLKLMKESELEHCRGDHPLWKRVAPWVKTYLEGGYCADRTHTLHGRVTFPVRDAEGRLVGIIGRCAAPHPPDNAKPYVKDKWMVWKVNPQTGEGKWSETKYYNFGASKLGRDNKPLGGFKTGQILYNLHHAKAYTDSPLLLTEGPFDVAKAIEHGYGAVVGVAGSVVTHVHWELITRYWSHIIYGFDPDTFARDGEKPRQPTKYEKTLRQATEHGLRCSVIHLPTGRDIGDTTLDEFSTALWQALNGTYSRRTLR